jgi:hypothetical protein
MKSSQSLFLAELAELIEKHNVVICSSTDDSEIYFVFNEGNIEKDDIPSRVEIHTTRNHLTDYDIRSANLSNFLSFMEAN